MSISGISRTFPEALKPCKIRDNRHNAATRSVHAVLIPRDGHVGYAELYNEKIAYLWLWAYRSGYFD